MITVIIAAFAEISNYDKSDHGIAEYEYNYDNSLYGKSQ